MLGSSRVSLQAVTNAQLYSGDYSTVSSYGGFGAFRAGLRHRPNKPWPREQGCGLDGISIAVEVKAMAVSSRLRSRPRPN